MIQNTGWNELEDPKQKFAIEEYNMLGEERRHLEETQIKYISMTLAAVIAIFTFGTTILTTNNQLFVFFIFIIPICLVIPTWLLFIGKAQRLTYLQAYSQLLESYLLGHITFTQLGFDNTLKGILYENYRKIHFDENFFPVVFSNINSFRQSKGIDKKSPDYLVKLLKDDSLEIEVELKRLLNHKTWADRSLREKGSFFLSMLSFGRIGSYWGLIYKIFLILIAVSMISAGLSLFFINTVRFASTSPQAGLEFSSVPNDITVSILEDLGANYNSVLTGYWIFKLLVFLVFFAFIVYLVWKITIQHYELHRGILSYEANYDMWCVVLDVKKALKTTMPNPEELKTETERINALGKTIVELD